MFKKLIKQALSLPTEKMEELTEVIACFIEDQDDKWDLYNKMDIIINGGVFSKEMAEYAVSKMEHTFDGKKGEYWTYEQTKSVKDNANIPDSNWYVLLNMYHSDFSPEFTDDEIIKMAKCKAKDVDATDDGLKVYIYNMLDK